MFVPNCKFYGGQKGNELRVGLTKLELSTVNYNFRPSKILADGFCSLQAGITNV